MGDYVIISSRETFQQHINTHVLLCLCTVLALFVINEVAPNDIFSFVGQYAASLFLWLILISENERSIDPRFIHYVQIWFVIIQLLVSSR